MMAKRPICTQQVSLTMFGISKRDQATMCKFTCCHSRYVWDIDRVSLVKRSKTFYPRDVIMSNYIDTITTVVLLFRVSRYVLIRTMNEKYTALIEKQR